MTWPRNRHQNIKTLQSTKHHHHGTAEGSFTAKKWFGHRAGRSPCAHSIGKFFLCYIPPFLLETSAPRLVRALLVWYMIHYIICEDIIRTFCTIMCATIDNAIAYFFSATMCCSTSIDESSSKKNLVVWTVGSGQDPRSTDWIGGDWIQANLPQGQVQGWTDGHTKFFHRWLVYLCTLKPTWMDWMLSYVLVFPEVDLQRGKGGFAMCCRRFVNVLYSVAPLRAATTSIWPLIGLLLAKLQVTPHCAKWKRCCTNLYFICQDLKGELNASL